MVASRSSQEMYHQLMDINKEAFEQGDHEVAYYTLAAALDCAILLKEQALLTALEQRAREQMYWIDDSASESPLSSQSASLHTKRSVYSSLLRQIQTKRLIQPDPPNEDPARGKFSSGEAMPLDAIVGGFEDIRKHAPIAEDPETHRVAVFVDGISDAGAMGLADDVRLLVDAFVRDPASVERERSAAAPAPDADPDGDVEIAFHGLTLGPEDERVLHRLIRGLVAERRAQGGRQR